MYKRQVSVYQGSENGVTFLGSIDTDLIANYGNSYANVFTIPVGNKKYIGVETFSSVDTTYPVSYTHLDVYKRQGLVQPMVALTKWGKAQVMGREKRATDGRPYKITN